VKVILRLNGTLGEYKILICINYFRNKYCDKIKEMRIFREVLQWEGLAYKTNLSNQIIFYKQSPIVTQNLEVNP